MQFKLKQKENQSQEEFELFSYLHFLNSAMAPFEMRKLISLIDKLADAKYQEGYKNGDPNTWKKNRILPE